MCKRQNKSIHAHHPEEGLHTKKTPIHYAHYVILSCGRYHLPLFTIRLNTLTCIFPLVLQFPLQVSPDWGKNKAMACGKKQTNPPLEHGA